MLAVDLHEHLVQVSPPVVRTHVLDPVLSDFGSEYRPESTPEESNRFTAIVDTTLVAQFLDVPERARKPDVHHHRQTDDLGARLEVTEGAALGPGRRLCPSTFRLKPSSLDRADRRLARENIEEICRVDRLAVCQIVAHPLQCFYEISVPPRYPGPKLIEYPSEFNILDALHLVFDLTVIDP